LSAGVDDYAGEEDVLDCARVYARTAIRLMQN
jgi:succinyl-diaminopimelate desuccinylase